MSERHASADERPTPRRYTIRLQGHLDPRWAAWFDGMTLATADDGTTAVRGPVADQAALHGVLQKVRDLGLPLVSVTRVGPTGSGASTIEPHQGLTTSRKEQEP